MGGGSSHNAERIQRLRDLDAEIGVIESKINQLNTLKNGLNQQIKTVSIKIGFFLQK